MHMPRLDSLPPKFANALRNMRGPALKGEPWAEGPPLSERRIAIVTTSGLHRRNDRPFVMGSVDYRVLPRTSTRELVSTHISPNFDRSGFAEDLNVVLPLDRLHELAKRGVIGSVADHHYSFMGAAQIEKLAPSAADLAGHLKADGVNGVLLVPV
jgi:D-proline reductase (dithiol) PrdB